MADQIVLYSHPMSRGRTVHWLLEELGASRFSAMDVFVGSQPWWAMLTKAIEPRPVVQQYVDRCSARPAMQRVNAGGK